MCECLSYEDGTRHTCEACVDDLETMRVMLGSAQTENARLRQALIAFVGEDDPDTLRKMAAMMRLIGRATEAEACEALIPTTKEVPNAF